MRKIDFSEVQKIWQNNIDPTMLYIHSPFCRQVCTYCVYKGIKYDGHFDFYYNTHLPQQIDKYRDIINNQNIQVIYFGGGTPNYNGLKHLIPVFEKIKDISCKEKVIELHTGIRISSYDIELLKKYRFTTVILCIQTFNPEILDEYNRYHEDTNDIQALIQTLHDLNISVGIDLIQFCDGEYDNEIFHDIKTILNFKELPDEITIAPLYQTKNQKSFESYHKLKDLLSADYCGGDVDFETYKELNTFRFFTKQGLSCYENNTFYSFINYLSETGTNSMPTATIGIGSYKNPCKSTYSFTRSKTYIEKYDGRAVEYFLIREVSFYDRIRQLVDWMERVSEQEPPVGLNVCISNNPVFKNHDKDYQDSFGDFKIYADFGQSDYVDNLYEHISKLSQE